MSRPSDALALARGDLRDRVAAIEGFAQLLASRRVGSRAITRAMPEISADCAPLRGSIDAFEVAIAAEIQGDPAGLDAVHVMLAHAGKRVDELTAALEAQKDRAMDARDRLALDAIARSVAADLATVMRLVDLLGARGTSEMTSIDLGDALAGRPSGGSKVTPIHAVLEARTDDLRVGDARVVLELLEFAVATVVRAGVESPRIVAASGPEGFPVFTVDAAPPRRGQGAELTRRAFDVSRRDALPAEAEVVRAAARHAGIQLVVAPDRRSVTIAL